MEELITRDEIEQFQQDGAICLRQIFGRQWLEKVAKGIEKNLANPSCYSEKLRGKNGLGFYFNDYCNWQTIGEFRDFVFKSPAAEIAGKLMKSEYSVFYHEHVLVKDPDTGKQTPWHHDQAYYPIDGFKNLSIWLPIDSVAKETTVKFVRGSHRWGKWFHPRKFASESNYPVDASGYDEEKIFENVPDIDAEPEKYNILQWSCEPGDCVVFHMMTLHAAAGNTSTDKHRRVLSTRWLGDDTVLARRPWTVSPPILGGLNYGDRIDCPTFPRIWTQERCAKLPL